MSNFAHIVRAGCASLLGGGVFLLVGLGLLGFGGFAGLNTYQQMRTWTHTTGRVVAFEYEDDGDGGTITMPVVEYRTSAGDVVRARPYQERHTAVDAHYDRGDQVEVIYNPDNPVDMFINDFMHVWFVPSLTGGMGTLFTFIGSGWGMAALIGALRRARPVVTPMRSPPTIEI